MKVCSNGIDLIVSFRLYIIIIICFGLNVPLTTKTLKTCRYHSFYITRHL